MSSGYRRAARTVAGATGVALAVSAVAVAAVRPHAGATYRAPVLSATTSLSGSLTVSGNGRQVKTMRLLFLTPPCPAAPYHQATALPARGVPIKGGRFRIAGTVQSYSESGLRGPADTSVSGKFLAKGTQVQVNLRQVITYPPNTKGCAQETITGTGIFSVVRGG